MKVDISCIVKDQFSTMGGSLAGWISDIFFFAILPLVLACLSIRGEGHYDKDVYEMSLTVFSIFAALLITAQITIFGLFQRYADKNRMNSALGSIGAVRENKRGATRRENLRQLNSNISYLTLLSCLSVTVILAFLAFKISDRLETFIATLLYTHFACSLAMVLKRFHIVFEEEYKSGEDES